MTDPADQLLEELREAQEARATLERRVAELEASRQALWGDLQTYAKHVSHDLRTPLTSVRGFLELLHAAAPDLSPQATEILGRAERSAARLHTMIDAIVRQMRLASLAVYARVDVSSVVEAVSGALADDLSSRGVTLDVGPLPSVWADREQLHDLFDALLRNAVAASPTGGVVEVRTALDGDRRRVEVVDHGPGIPEGQRARALELFGILGPRAADAPPGVGLALAAGIVAHHGGRLELDDTPGGGLTVSFSLPDADLAPRPASAAGG